ncbi:MAG: hypothetical protein PHV23_01700 [Candidatus Gracilibacteria bacterium]|nr:hypothetical protein [Candidatus Gracilibacteria bacterium]
MKTDIYKPTDFFAEARDEIEVNSFLNNDLYKFMMLDFILAHDEYKDLEVNRKMTIRSKDIKTANVIPKESLISQLDATKKLSGVNESELTYLGNLKKPNGEKLFRKKTIDFLRNFKLPDYELGIDENDNYELEFIGPWATSIMWEIAGLKIINSSYLYNYIKKADLSNSEFSEIINTTLSRLYNDIEIFKQNPGVKFLEYGTRRSASTDFQRKIYEILRHEIPEQCIGTSNVMFSKEFGTIPKGTNAHELRMIPTALFDEPEQIIETMYNVDRQWAVHYPEAAILLPDTYGSSFYFKNCPKDIFESHIGCRFDSKDPMIAIPEYVDFVLKNGGDPSKKVGMPSDGLDAITASQIYAKNSAKLGGLPFGIGTNLSNNTKGTFPKGKEKFGPFGSFSVVIKPNKVKRPDGTWVSCVKLSDNFTKATGDKERIELFRQTFGQDGAEKFDVFV